MLSYLFQEFATNEESEELINIFNKSIDYVFHLIEQMETLNSVENLPLNVYVEEFNLNNFIEETVKSFKSVAEAKSIKLNQNFKAKENIIKTDINFLKRVLYNVISNAIKFSPFEKNIFIDLEFVKNNFLIKIKDEGPGISEDDKKKLFDKFNKLKNKPTNSESSSGLGLFIVKELLKNLKGQIDVTSKIDVGTTFTIILPKSI
ncbi:MAG: HAMP domain-containing histidine kinase [Oligoflexus sp.]|nr:HAMP domain-containing histidine kinase [Pseudopedobacter sp.]